jgi:hypothetical protein
MVSQPSLPALDRVAHGLLVSVFAFNRHEPPLSGDVRRITLADWEGA